MLGLTIFVHINTNRPSYVGVRGCYGPACHRCFVNLRDNIEFSRFSTTGCVVKASQKLYSIRRKKAFISIHESLSILNYLTTSMRPFLLRDPIVRRRVI